MGEGGGWSLRVALARQGCSVRMLGEFSLRDWWSRRVALARQGCSVRMLGEFSLRGGGGGAA